MSILDSLMRFIDPVHHRQQQEDRRRKREALPPDVDGDDIDEPASLAEPRVLRECRICRSVGDGRFCPRCLAETMEPIRRR